MTLVKNYYVENLSQLKRKYTRLRHEIENATEVFAEFLHQTDQEESFEKQYFNSRIQEMRIQQKDIEVKYRMMGGDVSALD